MKNQFTYQIVNFDNSIITGVDIEITKQKTGWFKKQATVLIKEVFRKETSLYVQPHFESIANKISAQYLKDVKLKNITWKHYNPYSENDNERNFLVTPEIKDGKIVDAEWKIIED